MLFEKMLFKKNEKITLFFSLIRNNKTRYIVYFKIGSVHFFTCTSHDKSRKTHKHIVPNTVFWEQMVLSKIAFGLWSIGKSKWHVICFNQHLFSHKIYLIHSFKNGLGLFLCETCWEKYHCICFVLPLSVVGFRW